jgi:recombination protein RecA
MSKILKQENQVSKVDPEKLKQLDGALLSIEKAFGKGAIRRLGDTKIEPIECISTGSMSLDLALGIGGVPRGRIVEIYGPESSGKTTITLSIIAEAQKLGGTAAFIDAEHALDPKYAKKLGVNIDELLVSQPDSGEQALEITESLVRSNALDVIVIDSVAALVPKSELEGDMGQASMGVQARLMSQALRKLTAAIHKSNTIVIFINQIRMKIGVMYGCFHYDTLVNFADGRSIPIGKVVDEKIEGEVYTFNEETNEIETKPIIDWHDNGKVESKEDFLHIQTESIDGKGRFGFTCTPNHKILTSVGWKEAKDLSYTDKLISKYVLTVNGTYGEFLNGCLIGDSHISIRDKNTGSLRFQDNENAEYLNWKLDKLQPILGSITKRSTKQGIRFESGYTYEFSKIKRELGKRDPVYMLKNFSDLSFAIWLMDDGVYDGSNGHSRYSISVKRFRNNKQKLDEIVDILSTKGLPCSYNLNEGSIYFDTKTSEIIAQRICKYVPGPMQYKLPESYRNKYEDFTLSNSPKLVTEEVKIKLIRKASDRQYRCRRKFDISVKDNHNYMVGGKHNGVIVHNSPETTTGGNALKFYASVRMDVRRVETITKGEEAIGARIRVKVVKNKVAPPFRKAEFDLYFDERGLDKASQILDSAVAMNLIKKSGAWFSYGDNRIGQGRESTAAYIRENPKFMDELESKIRKALASGESVKEVIPPEDNAENKTTKEKVE